MSPAPRRWILRGHDEAYDRWADLDQPAEHWQDVVLDWFIALTTNPYPARAIRRLELGADWWFAEVAGDDNHAITCLYRVDEDHNDVQIVALATLRRPI